jgi:hypothetical protein
MSKHIKIDLFQASKKIIEFETLAKNITKEVIGVIFFLHSFLTRYYKRRRNNMLALILDPRFKSLKVIFFLIGCEHGVAIVEKYDRKSLFSMFLIYYHHLHPL